MATSVHMILLLISSKVCDLWTWVASRLVALGFQAFQATAVPLMTRYPGTVYIFQFPALCGRPGLRGLKKQYTVPRFPGSIVL